MVKASGSIVTYNAVSTPEKKKLILAEIEKLLEKRENVDFTLYIIDNASGDGTAECIKEHFKGNKNLVVVSNKENVGFGKAHNQALALAKDSKYFFVINPDIALKDDIISVMCAFFEENENCGMISPDIRFPDGRRQILAKRAPKPKYLLASRLSKDREKNKLLREYAMLDEDLTKPFIIENCSGCFFGIRTALFNELGGFDERFFMYLEDYDLARRVNDKAEIWYCPDAVVYHEWGRDSKRNNKLRLIHISSVIKYFSKWGF